MTVGLLTLFPQNTFVKYMSNCTNANITAEGIIYIQSILCVLKYKKNFSLKICFHKDLLSKISVQSTNKNKAF